MEIVIDDLRAGYVEICQLIRRQPIVDVRGLRTTEATGVTIIAPEIYHCMLPLKVNRGVNLKLAAIEALCLIGGVWRQDLVELAAPAYADVLVGGDPNEVAYGPRTAAQLSTIVDQLAADPTTRQALLTIWRPSDLVREGDKPCTLTLQFLLRRSRLECHVNMRSNDVWLGLAIDVFVFTQLQHTIANVLGVRAGKYVHHAGSLHAYERDWEKIDKLQVQPATWLDLELPNGLTSPQPVKTAKALLAGRLVPQDHWYSTRMEKLYELPHTVKSS